MRTCTNQLCLIVVFFIFNLAEGQVNDNFMDGNFTSNPTWTGDTSKFDVALNELWLNAPAVTDVAFLSTQNLVLPNSTWEFYNRMAFNPSATNYCRFYLVSDQQNLNSGSINGYYVELGRINDEVSLYKVVNGTSVKIIDGPDNMLNATACTTRIRVIHTLGTWDLMIDSTGGNTFTSLGTINDATITSAYYSGVYCKYTSTRSDKFFFDDVVISGTPVTDIDPPGILSHAVSGNTLTLLVNEPVQSTDLTVSNFSLDNGLTVTSVLQDSLDSRKIHITASAVFAEDVFYILSVTSLHDLFGNSSNLAYPFVLHIPVQGDVVINEIMADPSPQVGLPDLEWIEIRNNSIYPMDLLNWKLKVGSTEKNFPDYMIQPNEYVLVTNAPDTAYFGAGGLHKIGITGFPSLTNGGAVIQLLDTASGIIDNVSYSLAWYKDPVKDDGGYTLERINPYDICMAGDNWTASMDPGGGTPAAVNSVFDTTQVSIEISAVVIDSLNVLVVFNKWMNPATFIVPNFNLPGLNSIQVLTSDSILLTLTTPLPINTLFNLTVLSDVQDCRGINISGPVNVPVVNYHPSIFDVLITELMVDETPSILLPASEYIELKNTLTFPVNANGWSLVVNGHSYTLGSYTIPADSFLLIVHSDNISMFNGINVAGISSFSGLTNESGRVELYHTSGLLYHAVPYSSNYYDVDAKDDGGWSLEMIDITKPCIYNRNWTASSNLNGGSPGADNSYFLTLEDNQKPHFIKTGLPATDTVILYFDEPVLNVNASSISFSNGVSAQNIQYSSPLLNEYAVKLQAPLSTGTIYYIRPDSIHDCEGNFALSDSVPVSIPQVASGFDLIINEILFDPLSNCIDYVEIYNRSGKTIDLSAIILGEGDTTNMLLSSYNPVHPKSVLIHPSEYLMISTDHEKIQSCYMMEDSTSWWDISFLPDFTNTSGTVGVSTFNQQNLDMFAYNDQMHFSILNSTDGVALERLRSDDPTQNAMNWHSAASSVGFGTPGYKNSQASPGVMISDDFMIDPPIFSPDNDGYQDYITISYTVNSPGYMINARIFDQAGRLEKYLVNNELIGTSGSFTWDGTNDSGGKVNIGIHIVYFELVGINGDILQFKKPVVVATKI